MPPALLYVAMYITKLLVTPCAVMYSTQALYSWLNYTTHVHHTQFFTCMDCLECGVHQQ